MFPVIRTEPCTKIELCTATRLLFIIVSLLLLLFDIEMLLFVILIGSVQKLVLLEQSVESLQTQDKVQFEVIHRESHSTPKNPEVQTHVPLIGSQYPFTQFWLLHDILHVGP